MKKGIKCCCITPLVILLLIVLVIVIAGVIVVNMTPNKLGIGDYEIADGLSFNALGLGDVKFIDMYKNIKAMFNADESTIITNPITEEDKGEVEASISKSNAPKREDGTIDYGKIVTGETPIVYDNKYMLTYEDTNIAYILNTAVSQSSSVLADDPDTQVLAEMNCNIVEVDINLDGEQYVMKSVIRIDFSGYRQQLQEMLSQTGGGGAVVDRLMNAVPQYLYLASVNNAGVDENGKLTTQSVTIKINNIDNAVLEDAILKVLASAFEGEDKGANPVTAANDAVGALLSKLIGNLGKIGTATVNENNVVIGEENIGIGGLAERKLSVITYTAE